jgi:hypothetical protein
MKKITATVLSMLIVLRFNVSSAETETNDHIAILSKDAKSTWVPADTDIQELESMIPGYVHSNSPNNRKPIGALETYRRQYIGITQNGKEIIYLNAFCETSWDDDSRWKTKELIFLDGGPCFFQIKYDPESKTILEFNVNGEA